MNNGVQRQYAQVNGLEMYCEVHGEGQPLVLLHGGLDTIDTCFSALMPILAAHRQVVVTELQAHGRTADIDRPLSYEQCADDVAGLLDHLGYDSADIFGFSLGGGVALQTAIRHPQKVRKLVVVSAPFKSTGWYPEITEGISALTGEDMLGTPWREAYVAVAPRPENWDGLVGKASQLLGRETYDWSNDVAAIAAPTLIVIGDADSIRPAHAAEMFGLLGGGTADGGMAGLPNSRLAILPATTHLDVTSRTELLLPITTSFLDAPMPAEN